MNIYNIKMLHATEASEVQFYGKYILPEIKVGVIDLMGGLGAIEEFGADVFNAIVTVGFDGVDIWNLSIRHI